MDSALYKIIISEGEEKESINSPLITGVYSCPFSKIVIITGYIDIKGEIILKESSLISEWALKIGKYEGRGFSNIEISVTREGEEVRKISVEKAAVLNYSEINSDIKGFSKFELTIQSKIVKSEYVYIAKEDDEEIIHIIYKYSKSGYRALENIASYISGEDYCEWDRNIEIFYRAIYSWKYEYSGEMILDLSFEEYEEVFSGESNKINRKIGNIIAELTSKL